jgi:hypothetical protein
MAVDQGVIDLNVLHQSLLNNVNGFVVALALLLACLGRLGVG